MKWHPDKNGGSRQSEERFKRIAEAYAVLSNLSARTAYDMALNSGQEAAYSGQQIDPRAAAAMFCQEMANLAAELSLQNVKISQIAQALIAKGCPENMANTLARDMTSQRKALVRKSASRSFLSALVLVVIGFIVLAISGGYLITTGLFIVGAVQIIRALYLLASGRAPHSRN